MNRTSIPWVLGPDGAPGYTWNPTIGCSPISSGCAHCYAARLASTRLAHLPQYRGLAHDGKWTGEVRFFPERLVEPMRLRKPSGIFVCDMGDLSHDGLTNEQIAAVFGVMAACPQHRFYVLTKRPARMRAWFAWADNFSPDDGGEGPLRALSEALCTSEAPFPESWDTEDGPPIGNTWPLPNVWFGTSVCTQAEAEKNIPELLATEAALRFLSVEPLLESVALDRITLVKPMPPHGPGVYLNALTGHVAGPDDMGPKVDWVIVGGESGTRARPCHTEWIRSVVRQCREADVAPFVKQLGARIAGDHEPFCVQRWFGDGWTFIPPVIGERARQRPAAAIAFGITSRAGADPIEWPEDLRVRKMPKGAK